MDNGYIKLHRKLLENPIVLSGDCYLLQLWIYILLKVNHCDNSFLFNGEEITIHKGEGVFGLNQMVRDLAKVNDERCPKFRKFKTIYYRRLKILEKLQNVKLKPTNKYTIISIINWDRYQENETQLKLKRNSTETQLKTNKNEENDKNIYTRKIFIENKEEILLEANKKYPDKNCKKAIEEFILKTGAKDYKYKNYKLAFYNWVREDNYGKYKLTSNTLDYKLA